MTQWITSLLFLVLFASISVFSYKRLLTFLRFLQQQDYQGRRFLRWIVDHKLYDQRLTFALLGGLVASLLLPVIITTTIVVVIFLAFALLESDPRFGGKKVLVLTPRAQRIFVVSCLLASCLSAGVLSLLVIAPWVMVVLLIALVQILSVVLVVGNMLLAPVEARIQKKYWRQAQQKLQQLNPYVIGVTGSFGKTSVKHILGYILATTSSAFITPGSVNTPMGIARMIRERLNQAHKYFVVEMGAYRKGSIAKICQLVAPKMGVITAIGDAHYERFQSLENTADTKLELADAVVAADGTMVLATPVTKFQAFARRPWRQDKTAADPLRLCDLEWQQKQEKPSSVPYADLTQVRLQDVEQTAKGLTLRVEDKALGQSYNLQAPIYGIHQAKNIALAFATARALEIDPESIRTALKSLPQITHRLEVKPQANGSVIIDDAFNANADGFLAALQVLNVLAQKPGRRILVTPGLVEMGAHHDEIHCQLGKKSAEQVDIALVVLASRIPTFVEGFRASKGGLLIEYETFAQAQQWLQQNVTGKDVVLLENDLPDIYEALPKL